MWATWTLHNLTLLHVIIHEGGTPAARRSPEVSDMPPAILITPVTTRATPVIADPITPVATISTLATPVTLALVTPVSIQVTIQSVPTVGTIRQSWAWAPVITQRTAVTIITITTRPWHASTGHVLGMDQPHQDQIAKHGLLQWDKRIIGKHETLILFQQAIWLLDEELHGPRKELEIIHPGHHLEPSKIFPQGRG
jgi:hypothetical protein